MKSEKTKDPTPHVARAQKDAANRRWARLHVIHVEAQCAEQRAWLAFRKAQRIYERVTDRARAQAQPACTCPACQMAGATSRRAP